MWNVLVALHAAISVCTRRSVTAAEWRQLVTMTTSWARNTVRTTDFGFTPVNFVSELFHFAACNVYITIIILHITNITLLICSIIHCVEWRSCFWVFFNLLVLCRRQSMALMKFSSIFENTGKNCNVIAKWHIFYYGKHVMRFSVWVCVCVSAC